MSEQKRVTEYLRGRIFWAKIFGAPKPNFDGDGREWTLEFEPDEKSTETLRRHGLDDRLKDGTKQDGTMRKGYEDRNPFLILKRKEFKYDGSPNEHIRVVDALNQTWSDNRLIGNASEVDIKVTIVDYGPRKKDGIYPVAIRVLDLVPFERQEFEPLGDEDSEYVEKAQAQQDTFRKDFGLDDDDEPDAAEEPVEEEETTPKKGRKAPIKDGELDDPLP